VRRVPPQTAVVVDAREEQHGNAPGSAQGAHRGTARRGPARRGLQHGGRVDDRVHLAYEFAIANQSSQAVQLGCVATLDVVPVDRGRFAGPHTDELPLNLQIVDFG
jgi:hypothetical protein